MGHEIQTDLTLVLIAVIAFIVLFVLVMIVKVSRGLVNPGDRGYHKGWTKDNFEDTPVAQHIRQHYEPSVKRLKRKRRRAERLAERTDESTLLHAFAQWLIHGRAEKLNQTLATREKEINLARKIFFSKQAGPRLRGDKISHGIRRHGFGHERHKHEIGGKK